MKNQKNLSASKENYIRAINEIVKQKKAARAKDISTFLGIGASSVTEALKKLSGEGYVSYEQYGLITLTEEGAEIAGQLEKRNRLIRDFLSNILLVDKENLEESIKQVEHGIKGQLLDRLVNFFHFTHICPCKHPKWFRGFKAYTLNGNKPAEKCLECISYCNENNLTKPFNEDITNNCCNGCD